MAVHVLTGAGSGIGAAVARVLLARGDEVHAPVRSAERAAAVSEELPGIRTHVADLSRADEVDALSEALPPAVDGLVHSAGVVELGAVADTEPEAWERVWRVNVLAVVRLTRGLLPALRGSEGHVVLVNSGQGHAAAPGWGAYAASKHALRAFADALRAEEAPHGVRVTSVYPGRTDTPMQEQVHAHEGAPYDGTRWIRPESVAATIVHALDLGRDAALTDVSVRPG